MSFAFTVLQTGLGVPIFYPQSGNFCPDMDEVVLAASFLDTVLSPGILFSGFVCGIVKGKTKKNFAKFYFAKRRRYAQV